MNALTLGPNSMALITEPVLTEGNQTAESRHTIGKVANDQLMKLMSLGLSYDEAVNRIIQEFLK